MSALNTVNEIKAALSKELQDESRSPASTERCKDMLDQLDGLPVDINILAKTMVGTVVSKFKADEGLGPTAKALLKKWKRLAKSSAMAAGAASASKQAGKAKGARAAGGGGTGTINTTTDNSASNNLQAEAGWNDLPPLRRNICTKLHSLLELSRKELVKSGINRDAFAQLCVSRADEVEGAISAKHKDNKSAYTEKARSLCFNIKKNGQLRSNILLGATGGEELVGMTSEELATTEKKAARDAEVNKLRDSRRLDWEQANEKKINEMCGIKGDLLNASLFTCGRCKSTKTTSTQKQTRSADEPMTVFVLCLNCGNRWKC